ncbi:restriction endonuclease subunit S, partial [Streptomyces sp. NPDC057074]|uniref:restriction endonuclease subunit S n=1 Tax=Streptomyces sp. NPDC057074 TaxID=3346015 RepID=UPI0036354472
MSEGLGSMPAHWGTTRVDRVATVNARIGWKALTAAEYQPEGYPFLATPNIKGKEIDFGNVNYISEFRYQESPELQLREGDVLLTKDGFTLGTVNVVRELPRPATVNGSIAVLRSHGINPRFLYYVIASSAIQGHMWAAKNGMDVLHLFQRDIKKIPLPLPPDDEQRRIADFLDAETDRIDRLAASRAAQVSVTRERFTALTREQTGRMALRSNSLPGGWQAVQLRRVISSIKTGGTPPTAGPDVWGRADEPGAIPWYGPSGIHDLMRVGDPAKHIGARAVAENIVPRFPSGSILVIGIGATAGKVAYIDHEATGNQQITALVSEPSMVARFLGWQLWAASGEMRELAPYTTLPIINNDFLKSFLVAVPSSGGQGEVVRRLDRAASQLNSLEHIAQKSSQLLQERRQALITAAVTGQFDVSTASGRNVT